MIMQRNGAGAFVTTS